MRISEIRLVSVRIPNLILATWCHSITTYTVLPCPPPGGGASGCQSSVGVYMET